LAAVREPKHPVLRHSASDSRVISRPLKAAHHAHAYLGQRNGGGSFRIPFYLQFHVRLFSARDSRLAWKAATRNGEQRANR
jgi:hypothetical protein